MLRVAACMVGLLAAVPAFAGEMTPEEARHFVVGKTFSYTCFEGTRGQGRVRSDLSVVGSIQFQGAGKMRYAVLPANTLRVKGSAVCASLRGLPFEPCFNLDKHDDYSFRGSISGLGFAACEFTRRPTRSDVASNESEAPLRLRPSLSADRN